MRMILGEIWKRYVVVRAVAWSIIPLWKEWVKARKIWGRIESIPWDIGIRTCILPPYKVSSTLVKLFKTWFYWKKKRRTGFAILTCCPFISSNRTGRSRGNPLGFYSGGIRFDSWPGHRLRWLRYLCGFPRSLYSISVWIYLLGNGRFNPDSFEFILH
jgi:hypothetical protein